MKIFNVRLEDSIHEELRKLADSNRRSLNSEIIVLIEQAVMRAALVERRTDPQREEAK